MNTEKLYEARKQKGFSQEELANLCNVSRQAVSKWENGQSTPDADNLLAISKALDVSIDYLLDNEAMSEQKVKIKIDYDDFMRQEKEYSIFEYKSKTQIFNIPLVHINFTRGMMLRSFGAPRRKARVAKGIIALGDIAIGVFALGIFSLGFVSLGVIGLSIIGFAVIQAGIFSFGLISIGFSAVGIIAIGWYSVGVLAIAKNVAIGVAGIGDNSIAVEAIGHKFGVSIGEQANTICELDKNIINETQNVFSNLWMPWPMRMIVEWIIGC